MGSVEIMRRQKKANENLCSVLITLKHSSMTRGVSTALKRFVEQKHFCVELKGLKTGRSEKEEISPSERSAIE